MTKKTTAKKPKKTTAKKTSPRKTAATRIVPGAKPTEKNLDIYGAKPIPWSRALKQLDAGTGGTYWLATTNPDGRPHVAAVGAFWVDGRIYFTSVSGGALTAEYSAPSAGPPPWNLYVVRPTTAFGVATAEPSGATRWQF